MKASKDNSKQTKAYIMCFQKTSPTRTSEGSSLEWKQVIPDSNLNTQKNKNTGKGNYVDIYIYM